MSHDDSNKPDKPLRSPSNTLARIARGGEIQKQIEDCFEHHDGKLFDKISEIIGEELSTKIKPHIDDAMQIVIESIDTRISHLEDHIGQPRGSNRFGFWVGLGVGVSLFLGFALGMWMRGML